MATTKNTVPFDFESLYTGLQTKFEDKGYDTAEGSNTSQLITAMAYLTSMLNTNTAVNINETLLPLATKRDNALHDARVLGYETAHKQSYRYRLSLTLTAGSHTIPKYTQFTAGSKTYYYMGTQISLVDVDEGYQISLDVKEGTLHKFSDNSDSLITTTTNITDDSGDSIPQYYVDIPFVDVEENGLEVFLTYYDEYGSLFTRQEWKKSSQFMIDSDSTLNNEFVRLDNIDFKTPRIYFSLAGVGYGIRVGTIVEINALLSSGTLGAVESIVDPLVFVHALPNIVVAGAELIKQGTDDESIASIQANAPMFHNSANRAVTTKDYVSISNRHSSVNTSIVWGGDEEYPKSPGHIWFTFTPTTVVRSFTNDEFKTTFDLDNPIDLTNWFIENSEIRSFEYTSTGQLISPGVWDVLDDYKVPTLEFHNRHPIYLDFEYNFQILKYNITTSTADIHQDIFNVVDNAFTGTDDSINIEAFNTEYFHSSIMKRIDQNLTDITGINNTIKTSLLLTEKNVSAENTIQSYRDIFIPLSVPFETYFNTNGELISSVLPSIDTTDFIVESNLDIFTDWSGVTGDVSNDIIITAPIKADVGGVITNVGVYYIFNSYRKYILIQLYVDAAGYGDESAASQPEHTEPKSYLTTTEGFYDFTIDDYYITTEGYALVSQTEVNSITGTIARTITSELYTDSVLLLSMFDTHRYLNLNYASANFKVFKNIIPRLKTVSFQ
jgi:hypothetical protein